MALRVVGVPTGEIRAIVVEVVIVPVIQAPVAQALVVLVLALVPVRVVLSHHRRQIQQSS